MEMAGNCLELVFEMIRNYTVSMCTLRRTMIDKIQAKGLSALSNKFVSTCGPLSLESHFSWMCFVLTLRCSRPLLLWASHQQVSHHWQPFVNANGRPHCRVSMQKARGARNQCPSVWTGSRLNLVGSCWRPLMVGCSFVWPCWRARGF